MINDEIRKIIDKLNYYTKLYDEGKPEISDKEYDDLYFKLQNLENKYNIYYEDSPTQSINYQVVNKLNKIKHNHLMLSLDKTKDINEIYSFIKNNDYIGMGKLDGLTCSLRYLNGKLVSAETRGNGIEGEDIFHNALQVKNIPNKIDYKEELIIDGEIICTYNNFKQFENEYKNPRNFASGSIRLLDSRECAKRNLSFIAWDIINDIPEYDYLSKKLQLLKNLDFTIVPYFIGGIGSDLNDLEQQSNFIKKECEELGYPIDGLVFKYDNCNEYETMGRTDHHFKGGLAYKFYDEEYETTLKDIEWTMGRTGVLTPVAIFEPIEIDGTEVSRANLFNVSVMLDTLGHAYKGEKLWIYKANQIIPQVSKADKKDLTVSEFKCDECPICGSPTELKDNEGIITLYCGNPACEGKLLNKIEHFFSKKGLNIKGISKATIEKLIDWGWVDGVKDIFVLDAHAKDWKKKTGFGEKSVMNIITSIREGCNTDLESIIAAAGIPLIGRTVARQIAGIFNTYEDFREAIRTYDFSEIDGFGYEMNKSLKNYDYTELDYIVENYLTITNNINKREQKLEGLTFVITGRVNLFKNRDELSEFITSLGGKVSSAISAKTNYLINNDKTSTSQKNKKAQELGVTIVDEQTFMNLFELSK